MMTVDDIELVRRYAQDNSEEAFATLVSRYINMVYSIALRHVHNSHQAEEITQAVFIILARKSRSIRPGTILSGWLYQTARLTAANYLRTEIRRSHREQEALMQSISNEPQPRLDAWQQIAPLLDNAMADLSERDRNAIVLRFFNAKNFKEVGVALGTSEDAAKMRVSRALEKLRTFFGKRGVSLSAAVLSGTLTASSTQAAPIGLTLSVTAAVVKGSTAAASSLTFVNEILKIMAWTKLKTVTLAGVGVLLTAGTATVTVKEIAERRTYPWQVPNFNSRIMEEVSPQVRIVPTKFPQGGGWGASGQKVLGIGQPVQTVISAAYGGWSPFRMRVSTKLPEGKYDYIANLPRGSAEALQAAVRKKFGLRAERKVVEMDVLILTVKRSGADGLRPGAGLGGSARSSSGEFTCQNQPLSSLTSFLENYWQAPVIDETGLTDRFDIDLVWDEPQRQNPNREAMKQVLLDELGLELTSGKKPIEILVVQKAD
jgi:uncharacterized protein (TIGR03435 family)